MMNIPRETNLRDPDIVGDSNLLVLVDGEGTDTDTDNERDKSGDHYR